MTDFIVPDWPAPDHIKAYTSTRVGGYSQGPYESFNLAADVGDDPENVATNRALLKETLSLPDEPLWLHQIHGNEIICADSKPKNLDADGSYSKLAGHVCMVQTADCIPALMTNEKGKIVAAIHAGWRGIYEDILVKATEILRHQKQEILVWLGPAIGQKNYQVKEDLYQKFITKNPAYETAFQLVSDETYFASLYELAKIALREVGVTQIYGAQFDTYEDEERFYSYRRDQTTGRMVSLIWISPYY